jgi:hypothetical protein
VLPPRTRQALIIWTPSSIPQSRRRRSTHFLALFMPFLLLLLHRSLSNLSRWLRAAGFIRGKKASIIIIIIIEI